MSRKKQRRARWLRSRSHVIAAILPTAWGSPLALLSHTTGPRRKGRQSAKRRFQKGVWNPKITVPDTFLKPPLSVLTPRQAGARGLRVEPGELLDQFAAALVP